MPHSDYTDITTQPRLTSRSPCSCRFLVGELSAACWGPLSAASLGSGRYARTQDRVTSTGLTPSLGEPPRKRRRVQDPGVEPCFAELGRDGSSSRIGDFAPDVNWSMGVEDLGERSSRSLHIMCA